MNSALGSLQSAYSNAEMKAENVEELQALAAGKISNEDTIYSAVTYSAYESAVNKLAEALENADNLSQSDADSLKANIDSAQAALEYSARNRELAELEALKYAAVTAGNYTFASYQALTDAKASIDDLVTRDKEAEAAEEGVIAEAEALNGSSYTENSYNALMEIVAEANAIDRNRFTTSSYAALALKAVSQNLCMVLIAAVVIIRKKRR